MRALLQRVRRARVDVGSRVVGEIGPGLLVLLGIGSQDTADDGAWLADKIVRLRIFADEAGAMNRSVADIGGEILVVSQFTLLASLRKGTRPSFHLAAPPDQARGLYETFLIQLEAALGRSVAQGEFGALMQVELVNDGPVTLLIDSQARS